MKSSNIRKTSPNKKTSKTLKKPIVSHFLTKTHPVLLQKILAETSEKIDLPLSKANQEGKTVVFVSQMYSQSHTEKRNTPCQSKVI